MTPQTVRSLAAVAMLGGAIYVAWGIAQLVTPGQTDPFSGTSDYLVEALHILALVLTLAGFVALHGLQAGSYGGPRGQAGFRAAVLGQGAILASAVASLAVGAPTLGSLSVLGHLALLVGIALLAVATHKAALLPGWSAYVVAALAASILGELGVVVAGLAWVALGYAIWSRREAPTGGPSRVM